MHRYRSGFTLIELLVVIAIVAVLAVVVVLVLNPAQLLQQARDSNRLSDLATINSALGYLRIDQPSASLGNSSTSYISVLDPSATSTSGDQCQGLVMPSLGSSTWQCAASTTYRKSDGTGWIPAALSSVSYGTPLAQLPSDPVNATSSSLFYSYSTNGSQYEVTAVLESSKYKSQFAANPQIPGYPEVAAMGSSFSLSPLWNPSGLVGWWPLTEGSGTAALDQSGSGNAGTWGGTFPYYATGKVGAYAGTFDGSTDYVSLGSAPILDTSGSIQMTVAAWVNSPGIATNRAIYNKYSYNTGAGVLFDVQGALLDVTLGANIYRAQSDITPYLNGAWHQMAAVINGAQPLRLYVDGSEVSYTFQQSGGVVTSSVGLVAKIGQRSNTGEGSWSFAGQLNDIRIYSRPLSAAEVRALYNAER